MSQFDVLPDERTIATTVTALEARGFTVEVVDDLAAAREAVLARIPHGARVWKNTSITLDEAGISAEVDAPGGPYESVRLQMTAQNFASRQMKEIAAAPDYALGSVHAITQDGELLIGSASGSQFATVAWGADRVVLVAGLHKVVPDLETARRRVREHSLPLENVRAQEAYGQNSRLGKTLEIYGEMPGRIHLVLIRQVIGY
ncbi:LUD domain-containing protein [Microbacterium ulmi]|uniref:LUD domain-containing protein n=1 Tax=Microbacterium ulmi TaxID=179095 RepID=A0A7Y2Q1U9_9MICO|nr:LUD domain-containing protein [Microbacterium ulmi]NII69339.1 acyl-CoA hydrolase [Microbacterium ulmi]NNH04048.1 LUD domain-containing protein [Microbacterium ulmi]